MAYTDFTLANVESLLGVSLRSTTLFSSVDRVSAPAWLDLVLRRGRALNPLTELDRTSFLVGPFFMALHEALDGAFSVHGGWQLNADPARGLSGECDFLFSAVPDALTTKVPIITAVEAKRQDVEAGIGQCIAQTYGARLFNEAQSRPLPRLYGVVTTGDIWVVFRLIGNDVAVDPSRLSISNPQPIFDLLAAVVRDGLAAVAESTTL